MKSNHMKTAAAWLWREWIKPILAVVAIIAPLRSSIADWNDVPTGSMKPTILEGDRVVVNKLAYDLKIPFTRVRLAAWDDPKRGDIVVFASPVDGTRLVKRIIGLPGDVIVMRNNHLFINDQAVEYAESNSDKARVGGNPQPMVELLPNRTHEVWWTPKLPSLKSFGPLQVPNGNYLMLGDNRDNSADSRYWGFVPRNRIAGKAEAVALSLNREHYYLPRFERFLSALR